MVISLENKAHTMVSLYVTAYHLSIIKQKFFLFGNGIRTTSDQTRQIA